MSSNRFDEEFLQTLLDIESRYWCLPKQLRIRTEAWAAKLSEEVHTTEWKRNRNTYAKLLLQMVTEEAFTDPFHVFPRSGPLPQLPSHLKLKLRKHYRRHKSQHSKVFDDAREKLGMSPRRAFVGAPPPPPPPPSASVSFPPRHSPGASSSAAYRHTPFSSTAPATTASRHPSPAFLSPPPPSVASPAPPRSASQYDMYRRRDVGGTPDIYARPPSWTAHPPAPAPSLAPTPAPAAPVPSSPGSRTRLEAMKAQLDSAVDLYQSEMAKRIDLEARLARAESLILKQDSELMELRTLAARAAASPSTAAAVAAAAATATRFRLQPYTSSA